MTLSSIMLASAYAGATAAPQGHDSHDGYAAPVSPEKLGGAYEFSDTTGRPVTAEDFKNHWTLLFFGYSRCKASCPVATPKMVKAARSLRDRGIEARAVFVDIDAPPLGFVRRSSGTSSLVNGHSHADMNRVAAMRALARSYDGQLTVLSGTRGQLANATRAFMVAREHTPPREGEQGHSINHSSRIYFIAPDTKVAGYGYHDSDPEHLAESVAKLSKLYRAGLASRGE
jgi:cytochrome oxidase Cu insertion factor (SCO1/SenC/PrrC family)